MFQDDIAAAAVIPVLRQYTHAVGHFRNWPLSQFESPYLGFTLAQKTDTVSHRRHQWILAMPATTLHFEIIANDGAAVNIAVNDLVVAGWTGRDAEAVRHHVEELAAIGVPGPSTVPLYYRGSQSLVLQSEAIQVLGGGTSGEVEPVLVQDGDELWVTVGSDHTDRDAESQSIALAKQACPKVLAHHAWRFADVVDHWDALEITSTIEDGGQTVTYQHGSLAEIRSPLDLIKGFAASGTLATGTVMLCGTVPAIGGIRASSSFHMRLHDPVLHREITHRYEIVVLPVIS
jgi:hypothetical protein